MSRGVDTQGYTQRHMLSIISAAMRLKGFPYLGFKGNAMGISIGISKGIGKGKSLGLGVGKSLGFSTNPYSQLFNQQDEEVPQPDYNEQVLEWDAPLRS